MSSAPLARSGGPLSIAGGSPAKAGPAEALEAADGADPFGTLMALFSASAAGDEGGEALDGGSHGSAKKARDAPLSLSDPASSAMQAADMQAVSPPPPDCAMLLAQGSLSGAFSPVEAALPATGADTGTATGGPGEAASAPGTKAAAIGAVDSGADPSTLAAAAHARIEQLQRADAANAAAAPSRPPASSGDAAGRDGLHIAAAQPPAMVRTTNPGSEATSFLQTLAAPPGLAHERPNGGSQAAATRSTSPWFEATSLLRAVAVPPGTAQVTPDDGSQTVFMNKNAVTALFDEDNSLSFYEQSEIFRKVEHKAAHVAGAELPAGTAGASVAASLLPVSQSASSGAAGLHAAFTERIVDQVSWWLSQNIQGADFKIEMPGGPPISVNVQVQGNEAQVVFRSDQAEIRQLLGQALPQLKEALGSEGLLLAGVSVGVGADGFRGQQAEGEAARHWRSPEATGRAPGADLRQPQPVAAAAATRRAPWSASGGALDLWA